jgi:hypothetical protein
VDKGGIHIFRREYQWVAANHSLIATIAVNYGRTFNHAIIELISIGPPYTFRKAAKVTSTFSGESGKGDIHIFRRERQWVAANYSLIATLAVKYGRTLNHAIIEF